MTELVSIRVKIHKNTRRWINVFACDVIGISMRMAVCGRRCGEEVAVAGEC